MSETGEGRWKGRPVLAAAISLGVFLLPIPVIFILARVWVAIFPPPSEVGSAIVWWVLFIGMTIGVVVLLERLAQRIIPLASLMKITLVFPDKAPSRFKLARKAGRTRDLQARLDQARKLGIHDEPTEAAAEILTLISALGSHDHRTRGHAERVRVYTDLLGEAMHLRTDERERLRWGALLHDIGKLSVPTEILNKPGRPSEEEWATLQAHPKAGLKIAAPLVPWLGPWSGAIVHHHEKFDGSGYPFGVSGEEISLAGRILSVADCYEVMTAARAYKKPMSPVAAREELAACAGTHFDPHVVRAFFEISLGKLWRKAGLLSWLSLLPAWPTALTRQILEFGRSAWTATAATAVVAAGAIAGTLPLPGLESLAPPPPIAAAGVTSGDILGNLGTSIGLEGQEAGETSSGGAFFGASVTGGSQGGSGPGTTSGPGGTGSTSSSGSPSGNGGNGAGSSGTSPVCPRPASAAPGPSLGDSEIAIEVDDCVFKVRAGDGTIYSYRIVVFNAGPSRADNVTIFDEWPTDASPVTGPRASPTGLCVFLTDGDFLCYLGSIPPGGTATVTIDYTVPNTFACAISNTARVVSNHPGDREANNTSTDVNEVVATAPGGPPCLPG